VLNYTFITTKCLLSGPKSPLLENNLVKRVLIVGCLLISTLFLIGISLWLLWIGGLFVTILLDTSALGSVSSTCGALENMDEMLVANDTKGFQ
jgi:hypothetical protein